MTKRKRRKPPVKYPINGWELTQIEFEFYGCWQRWGRGLPDPVHDYQYAEGRRLRADFAWPAAKVLVECEGGIFTGQAHGSIGGILRDIDRANEAAANGWLRFRVHPKITADWDLAYQFTMRLRLTIQDRLIA